MGGVALALLMAVHAFASDSIFVQVPGATGSSTTAGFIGQINADSVSWGFRNNSSIVLAPIVVTKRLDTASTSLMKAGAAGTALATVTISHVTLGGSGTTSVAQTTVLTGARITDYQLVDSEGGGPPLETITFSATSITFSFVTASATGVVSKPATATMAPKQ
jgi:type VI protein secretion system component Hcp